MTDTEMSEEAMLTAFNKVMEDREQHLLVDKTNTLTLRKWLAKVTEASVDDLPKEAIELSEMYDTMLSTMNTLLEDLSKRMNKERLKRLNTGKN
jgi:hypothetical protein